jgi:rsbT co-antagonist protein RsbR
MFRSRATTMPHFEGCDTGSARMELNTLLRRHEIEPADLELVRELGTHLEPRLPEYVKHLYAWMRQLPEYEEYFSDPKRLERVQRQQVSYWQDLLGAELDEAYVGRRRATGEMHARIGLGLPTYFAAVDMSLTILADRLLPESALGERKPVALRALTKLVHLDTAIVVDAYNRLTSEKLAGQARALLEMSTPVTALWEDVLLMPIVGIIDSRRAQDIMGAVLGRIAETRARVFIIDIGGVSVVDTAVANHLIKITKATRLMGCECLLSGISAGVAQTIIELGIDVGRIETRATLRDALEEAFRRVGIEVRRIAR